MVANRARDGRFASTEPRRMRWFWPRCSLPVQARHRMFWRRPKVRY